MKKIGKIILSIIIVIILGILYMSYLTNHNQNYLDNITKNIEENYKINDKITYSNQYGNYYIFTTKDQVIVLNKDYEEVIKENLSTLKENTDNYPLIYKTNKLMYEKTKIEDNTLIYEYYDAKTKELIKTTTMEQQ